MTDIGINLRGPAEIWSSDSGPGKAELERIKPGSLVQSGVKTGFGIDSVWIKIRGVRHHSLDGIIVDGPETGQTVRFHRRDVWRIL